MSLKPVLTIIMDGFGISKETVGNAVFCAKTPNLDAIFKSSPYSELSASGKSVGLPEGQMGNSEVGHMNIGAGRIVFQDLSYIDNCISSGSFFENKKLNQVMKYVVENDSTLHLMGLLSDGAIHSSIKHLYAILRLCLKYKIKNVFVHVWTDGRDTPIKSAEKYISDLQKFMKEIKVGEIKTICGRFFSMDRNKNYQRTNLAFECISNGKGRIFTDAISYLKSNYNEDVTDEFIIPAAKYDFKGISKKDAIICFNFRADRVRQISSLFLKNNFFGFTQYSSNINCIFEPRKIKNTIGEYLSKCGKTQLRIAETEKYAHVTFFLNAGQEKPFTYEERIIIESPNVKTYDLFPQMSADELTNSVEKAIKLQKYDVIFLNFANPDMVGHTGNFEATVKAIEKIDKCVEKLTEIVKKFGGVTVITADHGNAEKMLGENQEPCTTHTCNLVPFAINGYKCNLKRSGILADIAPTILDILKIKKPAEMTGESLILKD